MSAECRPSELSFLLVGLSVETDQDMEHKSDDGRKEGGVKEIQFRAKHFDYSRILSESEFVEGRPRGSLWRSKGKGKEIRTKGQELLRKEFGISKEEWVVFTKQVLREGKILNARLLAITAQLVAGISPEEVK